MMSKSAKLNMLKAILGIPEVDETEDDRLSVYLSAAEREILSWRYSYSENAPTTVPAEYEMTQIQAVVIGYGISGAEGQRRHDENGIYRTFKYADMIEYIRQNVVPIVKVI